MWDGLVFDNDSNKVVPSCGLLYLGDFACLPWRCGGVDFEGCLVFDEAHKAKNFNSVKEENSTKVAQAVIKLQVIGCIVYY